MCFHKCIALSLNNAVELLFFDMFIELLSCQFSSLLETIKSSKQLPG